VTGKKFCPECGTPVHSTDSVESENNSTHVCPRCNGVVKPGAAFCMHCGSSLSTQTAIATATPTPPVQSQPLTQTCIACHTEVPNEMAFCTNCGQSMRTTTAPDVLATPVAPICANCGKQNNPGVNFCAQCGSPLSHGTGLPVPQTMYAQPQQYSQPYSQYPQQSPQYGAQYPQQPMVLRCPICMAMSPLGTPNCPSCHTSLANVAPTPANMPVQNQQGGMGGLFQGSGGNMAMGALGGAAAVIGGEILLHEVERGFDRNRGGGDGLLGGLGDLANDVGLF
ncbi:MAG TPA: zinc ribbon domain-containing protein, partial [Ktedonobacteraceae bacterium]|nr:zinc ribbon domain-containing protein [Ktedonobacteraceae bacterium]